jgi:hypothetical protein
MSLLLVDLLILVVQEVVAKALIVIAQFATALVILLAQRVDSGHVIFLIMSVVKSMLDLTQAQELARSNVQYPILQTVYVK